MRRTIRWSDDTGGRVGKRLVIAEKPSVARDIASALGGFQEEKDYFESEDFIVTWAMGHLLQLSEPDDYDKKFKSWSLKNLPIIPTEFVVKPRDGQKGRLNLIKKLGKRKDVTGSVNACDAGREGEMIYRRIASYAGLTDKGHERLWLRSMTMDAIREGFEALKPGSEMDNLADAAWCRSVGDWLIGMNATRALTQRLKSRGEGGAWTAGRVQTPTLNLLVEREKEILGHVAKPYWELEGTFAHGEQEWVAKYWDPSSNVPGDRERTANRIFDAELAAKLMLEVKRLGQGQASETRKNSKQQPPLPFDLTSLQREANKRFSFSAKRTGDSAQRLYESHKLITYPRTDARFLPDDYQPHVEQALELLAEDAEFTAIASKIVEDGPKNLERLLNSEKVSDHFAIIPTLNQPEKALSPDDDRIYGLVVRQFFASLMGPAHWTKVERLVELKIEDRDVKFRATGRNLEIPGFLEALRSQSDDETAVSLLPPLIPGQNKVSGLPADIKELTQIEKETKPPGRYTEAALLRMMETAGEQIEEDELSDAMKGKGLGTPATRAEIIEGLVRRIYARRAAGKMMPTTKAMRLIDVINRVKLNGLTSPKMTGEWEHALGEVQAGEITKDDLLGRLVKYTEGLIDVLVSFEHDALYVGEPDLGECPTCKKGRIGESAWGYPCSENKGKDSECNFMVWKDRNGRYLDRQLVRGLIREKKTPVIGGFFDGRGRESHAELFLEMDEEKGRWVVRTRFENTVAEDTEPEVITGPLQPCPVHEDCQVLETNLRYVCAKLQSGEIQRGGCVLPKKVCHRDMTEEEAKLFFSETGRTELMEGFISKRGRPFRGLLFRKENGRHGFEFPPREPRAAKTRKKSTKGAKPKKKTTAKTKAKTATKRKTKSKATTKK